MGMCTDNLARLTVFCFASSPQWSKYYCSFVTTSITLRVILLCF